MDRQSALASWARRRTAAGVGVFVLAAAVPAVLQAPAVVCQPVGGELPGIDCLAGSGAAAIGSWLFAFFLGLALGAGGADGSRSARPAILGLVAGGLAGFALLSGGGGSWLPHGLVGVAFGVIVVGPAAAFAIGRLLGTALVRVAGTGG